MQTPGDRNLSRRNALALSLSAGASLALTPALLAKLGVSTQEGTKGGGGPMEKRHALIERTIPKTGEKLPVISFGARALKPPQDSTDHTVLKPVFQTFLDHGGKVVDVMHGGPAGETAAAKAANELGIQNKFFWTTPVWVHAPTLPGHDGPPPKPSPDAIRAQVESKLKLLNVPHIDCAQMLAHTDLATHLAVLSELKKEGKVRYIGYSDLLPPPGMNPPPGAPDTFGKLETAMRELPIDFIGLDYSVGDRRLEDKILPLAQEKKIAVFAYFPFDRARIFKRATETKLPEWAIEFGAETWAQFFLKYVVAHPAVTAVRCGTTKAEHMLDNLKGGMGVLPDEKMRKRMAELVDSLPPTPQPKPQTITVPPPGQQPGGPGGPGGGGGPQNQKPPAVTLSAETLDRYVGDWKDPNAGTPVKIRRDGDRLRMKPGKAPEGAMTPLSETRFITPWGAPIEFKLDASGKATSATVEQGPHRIEIVRQ
ncbi:MAG TPA: aldo/keto reductase [Phycisphaerales bacterium]|nr:aldo/keto reductase [Phycisphaerales bacterium]